MTPRKAAGSRRKPDPGPTAESPAPAEIAVDGQGEPTPTPESAAARFRDRIVELRRVPAAELRRNPKNFRTHSLQQRQAIEGVLGEVGFAGATLAFVEDGQLVLIDGHLRADVADDATIPVLVTDLTAEEASKVLASHDVLGSLANLNVEAYDRLLGELSFDSRDLEAALDDVLRANLSGEPASGGGQTRRIHQQIDQTREMDLLPHEHYDYVIVLARTKSAAVRLGELLGLGQVKKPGSKRIGIGRAISAEKLIELLES